MAWTSATIASRRTATTGRPADLDAVDQVEARRVWALGREGDSAPGRSSGQHRMPHKKSPAEAGLSLTADGADQSLLKMYFAST
jgi:hypothetical protein